MGRRVSVLCAFSFDGYQWLRDGSSIPGQTSQSYTPAAGDVGHQLSCAITVAYPSPLEVTTSATSPAITVIPQNSGPTGPTGAQGTDGSTGSQGTAGRNGATGPRGPQGLAGKVELVTCKTVTTHGKKQQKCTTKLGNGPVKFTTTTTNVHAALSRHGATEAAGYARHTRTATETWLLAARHLAPGRYTLTLTLTTQHAHRKITTRTQVTIT